ncbi:Smr/MutS family protein [Thiosocius teredinicola]|uniref:Smr/MutS family protein n=1 Tax=Thiosocius teredinicola TaxID=1973002 RepID=UPI002FE47549
MILQTVHRLTLIYGWEPVSIDSMGDPPDTPENDDSDLFQTAMGDVEPITPEQVEPYRKKRRPEPLNLPVGDEQEDELADLAIETGEFLEFRRPGIQNRLFRDLQRGVIEPEGTLDLHGLRVHEAKPALVRFLNYHRDIGRRCVRIIHGKGRGSGQQPVLKQKTNQWLRQREDVLAFATAPRWDGGTGAVYVLLSGKFRRTD